MKSYCDRSILCSSFILILVLAIGMFADVTFAQGTDIFREIAFDLGVDPLGTNNDAGGMVDVNNDGWLDIYPGRKLL
jgi:hypothetical protein